MMTLGMLIIIILLIVILVEIKSKQVSNYSSELDSIKSKLSVIRESLLEDNSTSLEYNHHTNIEKNLENIADDLFLIKMELKLIRIDELLVEFDETLEEEEYNLRTSFQRMYYCINKLKSYVFWEGGNPDGIKKKIDSLKLLVSLDESAEDMLSRFVENLIRKRNQEIGASIAWIQDKKSAYEYKKIALEGFEREKKGLSRIEAVQSLNRIQWRCEVLNQMEEHFKENNSLEGWEYETKNIFSYGDKDERPVLDY